MPPITAPDPEVQMPSPAMDDLEKLKPSPVLRIHLDELSHPGQLHFLKFLSGVDFRIGPIKAGAKCSKEARRVNVWLA